MEDIALNAIRYPNSIDLDVLARTSAEFLAGAMPFDEESSKPDSGFSSNDLD